MLDVVSRSAPRKEFTVERQFTSRKTAFAADGGGALLEVQGSTEKLMARIEALHTKFDNIGEFGNRGAQAVLEDDDSIRLEITRLVKEIGRTKSELASLRHPMADKENDKITNATNELDAIVDATEHSTNTILKNCEEINALLECFRRDSEIDDEHRITVDQIEAKLISIMEACNFQDITGQRITKVVNTMRFIEERIKSMIEVWGVESFNHLPVPEDEPTDEDQTLLAGPQLEDHGLTQDDIDAMFD